MGDSTLFAFTHSDADVERAVLHIANIPLIDIPIARISIDGGCRIFRHKHPVLRGSGEVNMGLRIFPRVVIKVSDFDLYRHDLAREQACPSS